MASPVAKGKQKQVVDGPAETGEESTKKSGSPATVTSTSPKRKHSEATTENDGGGGVGNGDNTTNSTGKKKRRKVNHACVYCRRSHMTCDLQRPCARCVKRDIGHLCHDEPRDPPKRSKSDIGVPEIAPAPSEGVGVAVGVDVVGNGQAEMGVVNGRGQFVHPTEDVNVNANANGNGVMARPLAATSPTQIQRPIPTGSNANNASNLLQNYDWNNSNVRNQFQDMHHLHPNYMFNTSEVTNEYNLLNDFLSNSIMDDGGIYTNNDDAQALFNDPLLATSSMNAPSTALQQPQPTKASQLPRPSAPHSQAAQDISRPNSTFPVDTRARDKFYMTAADPAGLSSAEDRLHKLLKAKYDAGMLKPFNYVKGYARLNQHMSSHMTRESQVRVLKQLDRFRPKFREAMQSLTDMQLVLVEMWFERSLMEYDRVFASMAIPACCWRRTGEIFRGNTEMAELIRVPLDKLRDGKLAIHEIIAEDSLVSYWEKFGAIAFDQSQKAILTSCSLRRPVAGGANGAAAANGAGGGEVPMETVRCCFSFTIRRDTHNM